MLRQLSFTIGRLLPVLFLVACEEVRFSGIEIIPPPVPLLLPPPPTVAEVSRQDWTKVVQVSAKNCLYYFYDQSVLPTGETGNAYLPVEVAIPAGRRFSCIPAERRRF